MMSSAQVFIQVESGIYLRLNRETLLTAKDSVKLKSTDESTFGNLLHVLTHPVVPVRM